MPQYRMAGFLGDIHHFNTLEEVQSFVRGARMTLWAFGIWREGVVYVGSSGSTFKDAEASLYLQYKIATGEDYPVPKIAAHG